MLRIEKLLPGYNCGECGLSSCREFASKLVDVAGLERCPLLKQGRFRSRAEEIARLLSISHQSEGEQEIIGVLDGLRADFALSLCLGSHPVGRIYIPSIPLSGWMRGRSSATGHWAAPSFILPGFSDPARASSLFTWLGRCICCRDSPHPEILAYAWF